MIHEGSSRKRAAAKRDGHPKAGDWLCRLRHLLSRSSTFPPPSLGGWSGLSPTARVEGAQFHRAASVSKGDDPDYLRLFV